MMKTFYPGTRVLVFDPSLFIDDVKTPLSTTMKPATVLRWYGKRSLFGFLMTKEEAEEWQREFFEAMDEGYPI